MKGLNSAYDVPSILKQDVTKINKTIFNALKNKDTCIITGQYAYNYYLTESEIEKDKSLGSKYKPIETPFMQIISTNYIPDSVEFLNKLSSEFKGISYKEYYPLWSFTGYSTIVYYKDFPVLHLTSHNNRCVPIRKINAICCTNGKIEKLSHTVNIGSFDFVLLMNLISGMRVRVNEIEDKYHYHNITTSHLVEMRNFYLNKHKKTLLDVSPFQSFIDKCIGDTMDPMRESKIQREKKYKEGKLVIFKYNPEKPREAPDYKFANTSGNEINNPINLKIKKYYENPKLLEDFMKKTYDEKVEENENESE
jgi:hypothetical protein